jgi:hypothetical protein
LSATATATTVDEVEAGSSDGTGSGTAAVAQRQPAAEKKHSAVRKGTRERATGTEREGITS